MSLYLFCTCIFGQVQVNFLPVGHTHEDVDQLFSKIGDEIRHTGAESIPGIILAYICTTEMLNSVLTNFRFTSGHTPQQHAKSQCSPSILHLGLQVLVSSCTW